MSMHHYLEHTRDPGAELDAAAVALEPGGLLSIEMPDPESSLARAMGRWWGPYLQPQHLNMVTLPNLEDMLVERGFTVIDRHRHEAHQACDFGFAAFMVANRLGPPVDVPWRPAPTRWSRALPQRRLQPRHAGHRPRPGARPRDGAVRAGAGGLERLPGARSTRLTGDVPVSGRQPAVTATGRANPEAMVRNASSISSASGSRAAALLPHRHAAFSAPLAAVTTRVG